MHFDVRNEGMFAWIGHDVRKSRMNPGFLAQAKKRTAVQWS